MQDMITVIRKSIDRDPRSLYAIAQAAKLPYATVHRFARAERTEINLVTAARLCQTLGLELKPKTRKGR